MTEIYGSLKALVPVAKVLKEAGNAVADPDRTAAQSEIPEMLAAVTGIGVGSAAGAGLLLVGAAEGAAGAAALTSGLATAGGLVGGGMAAGIAVVAAPAVILGVAGYWLMSKHNKKKLHEAKEAAFQRALGLRDALIRELRENNSANHERVDYLTRLLAVLQATVQNLQSDLSVS